MKIIQGTILITLLIMGLSIYGFSQEVEGAMIDLDVEEPSPPSDAIESEDSIADEAEETDQSQPTDMEEENLAEETANFDAVVPEQGEIAAEEAEGEGENEEIEVSEEENIEFAERFGFGVSYEGFDFFLEYGGGTFMQLGTGYSLYGGLVIPQIAVGYTPVLDSQRFFEVRYRGFNASVMLYTKFVQFQIIPDINMYLGGGASFTYFVDSGAKEDDWGGVIGGLYLTQGFEFLDMLGKVKNISIEIKEAILFEQTQFAVFQLGFGFRFGFLGI